jgi:hypothetical protein
MGATVVVGPGVDVVGVTVVGVAVDAGAVGGAVVGGGAVGRRVGDAVAAGVGDGGNTVADGDGLAPSSSTHRCARRTHVSPQIRSAVERAAARMAWQAASCVNARSCSGLAGDCSAETGAAAMATVTTSASSPATTAPAVAVTRLGRMRRLCLPA